MRNYRKLVLIVFLVSGSLFGWAANLKPFVVPELTQWSGGEGQMQPSGQIVVASPALRSMAQTFCHDYTLLTGRQMSLATGNKAKAGDIVMMLVPDELCADIYNKQIAPYMTEGKTLAFAHRASAVRTAAVAALWLNC